MLGKYSWSGDGNCQEGVCCILWTEKRRQGNLVVEVKYLKEEAEKEGSSTTGRLGNESDSKGKSL